MFPVVVSSLWYVQQRFAMLVNVGEHYMKRAACMHSFSVIMRKITVVQHQTIAIIHTTC